MSLHTCQRTVVVPGNRLSSKSPFGNADEAGMQFASVTLAYGVVIGIGILCPQFLTAADADGESWREKFLTEAPRKWAEYRVHSDRFQGSVTMLSRKHWGAVHEKSTAEIKQNQALGCVLVRSWLELC